MVEGSGAIKTTQSSSCGVNRSAVSFSTLSLLCLFCCGISFCAGFAPPSQSVQAHIRGTRVGSSHLRSDNSNPFSAIETLERLDQQWKIEQRSSKQKSRWNKLVLPKDGDDNDENNINNNNDDGNFSENLTPDDFVWLLEPPNNNIPSCLIVFVGGAGLGQFPNIAYSEFLTRISDRLNAAVLAAPYSVKLDHFAIAKQTGERIRKGILLCEDDPTKLYPPSLPTYCVAHSLGCKLQTIYMGATGQQYEGIGFISYNNFGFAQTIGMVRSFADQLRRTNTGIDDNNPFSKIPNMGGMGGRSTDEVLDNIFGFAETMVGAIGVEFSPDAKNTEKIIEMKFGIEDQSKTRLFVFDDDELDSSPGFYNSCERGIAGENTTPVTASGLPGGHLTPVFFKLGVDNIPDEAKGIASEAIGDFKSASFGDEGNLNDLVQEVCDWILGKPPSKQPKWDTRRRDTPQLTGDPGELPKITGRSE